MLLALLLAVLGRSAPLPAQEIPVEDFFRNPEFSHMRLSPNGRRIAALVPLNQRRNIAVLDVAERRAVAITNSRSTDITSLFWATDERLVYTSDVDGNESYGLYAVDRDGTDWRQLAEPTRGVEIFPRRTLPLDRLRNDPQHVLVTNNERRKLYPDVFKLDIHTGRMSRWVANPGYVTEWLTDREGRVRLGVGHTDDPRALETRIVYRPSEEDEEWIVLDEFGQFDEHGWRPLGFAADDETLYVASNIGRDTAALSTYDTETGQLGEPIFQHEIVDIDGIRLSPLDQRLLSVRYEHERPAVHAVDAEWSALRRAVDQALPDTFNDVVSISDDEQRLLIFASSDVDAGSYYYLDRKTNRLEYFASRRPWLKPADLVPMEPISFQARDGVAIHGYLTRPAGEAPLPLILHPHGGPYGVRDRWGFDPAVQFLANRGYAVLQVNFRGSGGYGKRFMDIAWRQWAGTMQDDLTDAVHWAVEQGIADLRKVCIYGASYGGYAAMVGVTATPDLYRCAVNYAGIVDVLDQHDHLASAVLNGGALEAWFHRAIGDPHADRGRLEAISPINRVEAIEAPVLIVHGRRDTRVPVRQAESITRALDRRNLPHRVLIKDDEGHGFAKEENNVELYRLIAAFFAAHL